MALPPKNFCLEFHNSARNAKNFLEAMLLATPPSIGNIVDFDQMIWANVSRFLKNLMLLLCVIICDNGIGVI